MSYCGIHNAVEVILKVAKGKLRAEQPGPDPTDDLSDLSDECLMAHLSAGCGDALAILFDRYQRIVYQIALNILRNAADAEDVVQNVFLEIYRAARQFDPQRGKARTWILQYAYHRSMDKRQQLDRYYNSFIGLDIQQMLVLGQSDSARACCSKRIIEEALEILKPQQRRVLELACFEGLSFREIAELFGEPVGNIRHDYYRGLCKLRTFLVSPEKFVSEHGCETDPACLKAREGAQS
jgi:RNA polymerase sigma-70 factor (ECF subfamily)